MQKMGMNKRQIWEQMPPDMKEFILELKEHFGQLELKEYEKAKNS